MICHRTDVPNSPFALLKPAEGGAKASGEINGLHFEDFRQWIRDNDNRCKGKDCKDSNYYLHSSEYNRDTMERSRALIGGTPKEGGSYECKVFAFHQKPGDKDSKDYSASLTALLKMRHQVILLRFNHFLLTMRLLKKTQKAQSGLLVVSTLKSSSKTTKSTTRLM